MSASSLAPHRRLTTLLALAAGGLTALPLAALATNAPTASLKVSASGASAPYTLWCGAQPLRVQPLGSALSLTLNDETQIVAPAISASGARYTAPGDANTELWNKGDLSTVTWKGQELPTCAPAGAVVTPFRASGNEPFWLVEYDIWTLTLRRPDGALPPQPAEVASSSPDQTVITAGQGAQSLRLTVRDGLCQDSMSGMPYPQSAQLEFGGQTFKGCGGDPARLIQGPEWQIHSIDGKPLAADSPIPTVQFGADGRIAGFSGCNRFMGGYTLTGEGLTVSQLAGTRMACMGAGDALEQQVMGQLQTLQSFAIPGPGQLVLRTERGQLGARLAKAAP